MPLLRQDSRYCRFWRKPRCAAPARPATGRCTTATSQERASLPCNRSVANVAKLKKAWTYQLQPATGNINPAPALASEIFNEVTPIVVNGVMYMPSGNRVVALEPETGKEIWSYPLSTGLASFRGVAYWPGDATHQARILFTSLKKMIALNAATGKLDTTFGVNGEVELRVGYAGVPLIYRNLIFIGAMIFGPGEQHLDAGTYIATGPAMNPELTTPCRRQIVGIQFHSAAGRVRK